MKHRTKSKLYSLPYHHPFPRQLRLMPLDKTANKQPRLVQDGLLHLGTASHLDNPSLVATNPLAWQQLDLPACYYPNQVDIDILSGNMTPPGLQPYLHCYHGHQFGVFAGQLGDGRALSLGHYQNKKEQLIEIQLKGAGMTMFSRRADGRAVLRSSIREYIGSIYNKTVGIPSSDSLSLVVSTTATVIRDKLYDGTLLNEPQAVLTRFMPSWLRVGSLENYLPASQQHPHRDTMVPAILQYLCSQKGLLNLDLTNKSDAQVQREFFDLQVDLNAYLVAMWQAMGFVHGVLNTDNTSLMGLTIDYGPFQYMEYYLPSLVSNASDSASRYAFYNQPQALLYNMDRLQDCLPLLQPAPSLFMTSFTKYYYALLAIKLGLLHSTSTSRATLNILPPLSPQQKHIIDLFILTLETTSADLTSVYRILSENGSLQYKAHRLAAVSMPMDYLHHQCRSLPMRKRRLTQLHQIQLNQPHLLESLQLTESVISQEHTQLKRLENSLNLSPSCFEQQHLDQWTQWLQNYMSMLPNTPQHLVNINPWFVPRNYLIEKAIQLAHQKDYSELDLLQRMSQSPFDTSSFTQQQVKTYSLPMPNTAYAQRLSCSS